MMDAPPMAEPTDAPPADPALAQIMETLQKLQAMIAAKVGGGEGAAPPVALPPDGEEDAAPPTEDAGAPPTDGLQGMLAKLKAKRSGPPAPAAV